MSFAIEDRGGINGRKKHSFYSVTASRGMPGDASEEAPTATGFAPEDVKLVRSLLCKHVVAAVYDDAAKRGLMDPKEAAQEARAVLTAYDEGIVKQLQSQDKEVVNGIVPGVAS